jgi:hypothetical protein
MRSATKNCLELRVTERRRTERVGMRPKLTVSQGGRHASNPRNSILVKLWKDVGKADQGGLALMRGILTRAKTIVHAIARTE